MKTVLLLSLLNTLALAGPRHPSYELTIRCEVEFPDPEPCASRMESMEITLHPAGLRSNLRRIEAHNHIPVQCFVPKTEVHATGMSGHVRRKDGRVLLPLNFKRFVANPPGPATLSEKTHLAYLDMPQGLPARSGEVTEGRLFQTFVSPTFEEGPKAFTNQFLIRCEAR